MHRKGWSVVVLSAAMFCMSSTCTDAQVDYPHLKLGGEGVSAPTATTCPS